MEQTALCDVVQNHVNNGETPPGFVFDEAIRPWWGWGGTGYVGFSVQIAALRCPSDGLRAETGLGARTNYMSSRGDVGHWGSSTNRNNPDDTNRGRRLFTLVFPYPTAQGIMNLLPDTVVSPVPENIVHRFPFGKIVRQISPLTTGAHQVKDGVDNTPTTNLLGTLLLLGDHRLNDEPLCVRQIRPIMGCYAHVTFLRDSE